MPIFPCLFSPLSPSPLGGATPPKGEFKCYRCRMTVPGSVEDLGQLIQLAIAPIFLLTGVATTLTVFASRLSRIVDRGRALEDQTRHDIKLHKVELINLEKRAHLIYRALTLGVCAAILVSVLMTMAFAGAVMGFNAAKPCAALFLLALFCYTGALLCLLREVFFAVGTFKLGIHAGEAAR